MNQLIKEIRNKCFETLKLTDELIKECQKNPDIGWQDKMAEDLMAKADLDSQE